MPSSPTLDIAKLIAPIPGPNPSGKDVRYDGAYDRIRVARRADDVLPQGEWSREVKTADWPGVIQLATDVLSNKSKDLQVAAWLLEALVKRYGFAGLRDGIRIMHELQERFWDTLYPLIEEGDLEYRAGPLNWLNKDLPISIKSIPITVTLDGPSYSYLQWEESRMTDNLARKNPKASSAKDEEHSAGEGQITGARWDSAVAATPLTHCVVRFEDRDETWTTLLDMYQKVDAKFGSEVSLFLLKQAIDDCRTLVSSIITKKGGIVVGNIGMPVAENPAADSQGRAMDQNRGHTSLSAKGGGIEPADRADALRRLAGVADFFRRTEPHSPVALLIDRAVRWGEMPLESWLQEVVTEGSALAHIFDTLGVKDKKK
jgi:type VI secretion system protein ImpA